MHLQKERMPRFEALERPNLEQMGEGLTALTALTAIGTGLPSPRFQQAKSRLPASCAKSFLYQPPDHLKETGRGRLEMKR